MRGLSCLSRLVGFPAFSMSWLSILVEGPILGLQWGDQVLPFMQLLFSLSFVRDKVAIYQLVIGAKMTRILNLIPTYNLTIRAREIMQWSGHGM